jgi:hypothetical protein
MKATMTSSTGSATYLKNITHDLRASWRLDINQAAGSWDFIPANAAHWRKKNFRSIQKQLHR